jgi:hypothetical protein
MASNKYVTDVFTKCHHPNIILKRDNQPQSQCYEYQTIVPGHQYPDVDTYYCVRCRVFLAMAPQHVGYCKTCNKFWSVLDGPSMHHCLGLEEDLC